MSARWWLPGRFWSCRWPSTQRDRASCARRRRSCFSRLGRRDLGLRTARAASFRRSWRAARISATRWFWMAPARRGPTAARPLTRPRPRSRPWMSSRSLLQPSPLSLAAPREGLKASPPSPVPTGSTGPPTTFSETRLWTRSRGSAIWWAARTSHRSLSIEKTITAARWGARSGFPRSTTATTERFSSFPGNSTGRRWARRT